MGGDNYFFQVLAAHFFNKLLKKNMKKSEVNKRMDFPAPDARGVLLPDHHLHTAPLPRLRRDQAVSELPARE